LSLAPWETAAAVYRHWDLLRLLVAKDLKVRYRGTALGFLWSLLNPLLMVAVYAVVFSTLLRFQIDRYPMFLLSGLLPWTAFAGSLTAATVSVTANGALVRRVRFARELLPVTVVAAGTVNLMLSLVILLVFALVFGQPLGWPLVTMPLLIALQTLFACGIALVVSAATVYFRDLQHLVGVGLTVWFFATPVVYPSGAFRGHWFETVLEANPMTWLMTGYQTVWHDDAWPDAGPLIALAATAFASWVLGAFVFKRLERRFAEEV
jgi:lipopolysaccharide transport system permease protein